ncbi:MULTISPECIES: AbrB family transcriptional regulator [unclassified Sphingomonas]|nr:MULTISPECIES: AbrB family transcriptional regulator [unclassified Sphingomonas]
MAEPARAARFRQWAALVLLSVTLTGLLELLRAPAALLLGPMFAGIAVAARGWDLSVSRWLAIAGQAVIGCLIAGNMAGALGPVVLRHWLLFTALTLATVGASGLLGYLLSRWRVVPGTVAIWGSMPGGAAAMVLLAEANGADARLVAVMVYTRVVTVTLAASALSLLVGAQPQAVHANVATAGMAWWFMPVVAAAGMGLAALMRWRSGTLMITMALGVAVMLAGAPAIRVPAPLLVCSFAVTGWRIGLSFTGEARGTAARMLPRILLAALVLVAFCGALAGVMNVALGIDPLTAWLAASPGGLESVAVIANSLPVDTAFVMAAQTARFGLVMLVGPALATALARRQRAAAHDAER